MPNVDFGEPSTSSLLTPQHDGQPSGEKTEGKKIGMEFFSPVDTCTKI